MGCRYEQPYHHDPEHGTAVRFKAKRNSVPSIDIFFDSVAEHWPEKGTAVLLTGMGRDGANGLKNLRDSGWHTIAQDEKTSVVYGMPKEAAQLAAATEILPIDKIGMALKRSML